MNSLVWVPTLAWKTIWASLPDSLSPVKGRCLSGLYSLWVVINIKNLIHVLDSVNDYLVNILKYVLALILSVQIILIFMTAVMRYVFNRPLSWSDELTTYMLVLITFLGGYVASNTGSLAKVEIIAGRFSGTAGKVVQLTAHLFSAALVGWIAFYGTKLYFSPIIQRQTSSALQMPVKYIWWSLPLSMWLLLFTELLAIVHVFVPRSRPPVSLSPTKTVTKEITM